MTIVYPDDEFAAEEGRGDRAELKYEDAKPLIHVGIAASYSHIPPTLISNSDATYREGASS
jgi:hypothetical protein